MTVQYGPWIAFNPGDTPPAGGVRVQVQLMCETRSEAMERVAHAPATLSWGLVNSEGSIIAYRVAKQLVRGEVVFNGSLHDYFSMHPQDGYRNPDKPARMTFTTAGGLLIPGSYTGPDGATIKIEAL